MNKSYRIDKDHIFVTDENGKIRKMPKYENVKEILRLQNDIEAIETLLSNKREDLAKNEKYRGKLINTTLICLGSLLLFLLSCMLMILNIIPSTIGLVGCMMLFLTVIISGKLADNQHSIVLDQKVLSNKIQYLEELKRQKTLKMEELKRHIAKDMQEKEETIVSDRKYSDLEVLKECLKILEGLNKQDVSIMNLTIASEVVQEVSKQKTLQM